LKLNHPRSGRIPQPETRKTRLGVVSHFQGLLVVIYDQESAATAGQFEPHDDLFGSAPIVKLQTSKTLGVLTQLRQLMATFIECAQGPAAVCSVLIFPREPSPVG
jgi:hypothetical protein